MKWIALLYIFSFIFCITTPVTAGQNGWIQIAEEIEKALHSAGELYEAGKSEEAMEKVADAYFGIFEGEKANMEIAVRRYISLKKATELEKGFGDIRKAMHNKAPLLDIKKQAANLMEALKDAGRELDRKGVGLGNFGF